MTTHRKKPTARRNPVQFYRRNAYNGNMDRIRGFTLVELMVTLAVAAIVLSIGVPSFANLIKDNRLTTQINDFVASVNLARSEAIRRGKRVTLCPSATGTSCSGSWNGGWVIFEDTANFGALNAGEEVIRVHEALEGGNTLKGTGTTNTYISYTSTGLSMTAAGTALSGTLILCDDRGFSKGKALDISAAGRPALRKSEDSGLGGCL